MNTDQKGNTALFLACSINDPEVNILPLVDFILQLNPDIHHVNRDGQTALHIATAAANIDVINKLIDEDFNVDAKAPGNITPLSIALKAENTAVTRLLLEKQCKIDMDQLSIAAASPRPQLLQIIQEFHPFYDIKDSNGQGILYFVKYKEVAEFIVTQSPSSVNMVDDAGFSPAMKIATKLGSSDGEYKDILRYLVQEKNSDLNQYTYQGLTVLQSALMKKQGGSRLNEVVSTLLEFDADVSILPQKISSQYQDMNTIHMAIQTVNIQVINTIINQVSTQCDKNTQQALICQPSGICANMYEFALKYKNADIIGIIKEFMVRESLSVQPVATSELCSIHFPEGDKKTIATKSQQTIGELLEPLCKSRGLELSKLSIKDKNNRKLKLDSKISTLKTKEIHLKKRKQ